MVSLWLIKNCVEFFFNWKIWLKIGLVRMRVWLFSWLEVCQTFGLMLKRCKILSKFLTVKKKCFFYSKKLFKTGSIIEKSKTHPHNTFFNHLFLVKKGIMGMRVWVWLGIIQKMHQVTQYVTTNTCSNHRL